MAKFWEFFKKIEDSVDESVKEQAVQEFVVGTTALPETAQALLAANKLRRAMWVMTPEGVGIVTGVYDKFIEVMLTDDSGQNKRTQAFEPGKLSQAKVGQIPAPRRPDAATAAKMGY